MELEFSYVTIASQMPVMQRSKKNSNNIIMATSPLYICESSLYTLFLCYFHFEEIIFRFLYFHFEKIIFRFL